MIPAPALASAGHWRGGGLRRLGPRAQRLLARGTAGRAVTARAGSRGPRPLVAGIPGYLEPGFSLCPAQPQRVSRLWFSGWGLPEVIAFDLEGNHEVEVQVPAFPCCVDWLPDRCLL